MKVQFIKTLFFLWGVLLPLGRNVIYTIHRWVYLRLITFLVCFPEPTYTLFRASLFILELASFDGREIRVSFCFIPGREGLLSTYRTIPLEHAEVLLSCTIWRTIWTFSFPLCVVDPFFLEDLYAALVPSCALPSFNSINSFLPQPREPPFLLFWLQSPFFSPPSFL